MGSGVAEYEGSPTYHVTFEGALEPLHYPFPFIPVGPLLLMVTTKFTSYDCPCVLGWHVCNYLTTVYAVASLLPTKVS
jgi:hypothetical protein